MLPASSPIRARLCYQPHFNKNIHSIYGVITELVNNLFVKAEKCEFHVPTVTFLGYVISEDSVQMDPSKVSAVAE